MRTHSPTTGKGWGRPLPGVRGRGLARLRVKKKNKGGIIGFTAENSKTRHPSERWTIKSNGKK